MRPQRAYSASGAGVAGGRRCGRWGLPSLSAGRVAAGGQQQGGGYQSNDFCHEAKLSRSLPQLRGIGRSAQGHHGDRESAHSAPRGWAATAPRGGGPGGLGHGDECQDVSGVLGVGGVVVAGYED